MIHAYLNVLRAQHGVTPTELENDDLANCIVNYWTSQLWTPANQHNFMVENFGPTIQQILVDIRDSLFTAEEIHKVEHPETNGGDYLYAPTAAAPYTMSSNPTPWVWNEFFWYQSFEGLQAPNSTAILELFPLNSIEYYYYLHYIALGSSVSRQ